MTKVIYNGPEGFASREIGEATGEGDLLHTGDVLELPFELAERLLRSSSLFESVSDYDDLTVPQLKDVAREQGRTGYGGMTKDELVALIRSPRGEGGSA
jgi:hypothetical protein